MRFHFTTDTSSFEEFGKLIREQERRTGEGLDDDVKIDVAMSSMTDDNFRTIHFVLGPSASPPLRSCGARLLTSSEAEQRQLPVLVHVDAAWQGEGETGKGKKTRTRGSEDTSTNQDTKQKCVYCDEVRHMQKDCQKRNSDTVSAQKHGRPHEKERKCSGSESAFVGSFDVNLLVDIEPGACGADHAPDDFEEPPLIDRDRLVFGLTKRKVVNVPGVSLNFCIMPMSLHVESAGAALAPEHVSACSVEGQ